MRPSSPEKAGKSWKIRWTDEHGHSRAKNFKTRAAAGEFAATLSGAAGLTGQTEAPDGFDGSPAKWMDYLASLAMQVGASGLDIGEKVRLITQCSNAAAKHVNTADTERRLQEIEDAFAAMMAARGDDFASAHATSSTGGAGAAGKPGRPVH